MSMGDVRSWGAFLECDPRPAQRAKSLQGAGIRILTPTISSPTLADQLRNFLKGYPQAKWHVYEPINRDNVLEGAKLAFGQPVETRYDFSKADVIVSLDADFLYAGFPGNTKYIRDFAKRRNPDSGNMNRLYVIESTPTSTGAKADHRLPVRAADIETLARVMPVVEMMNSNPPGLSGPQQGFGANVWRDLQSHLGASVVIPGDYQSPVVHALAHAMNAKLGNVGKTVFYTDSVEANPVNQTESIKDLVADMNAGKVDLLIILGGNPAYDAPADLNFADALKNGKTPLRVHYGLYQNETAELCQWHVNATHELEAWGDARTYDGTASIIQPLIAPLYNGKSPLEFVALLSGQADATGYDLTRAYWQKQHTGADFEQFWRKSLHDGWIEGTAFAPKSVSAKSAAAPSESKPTDPSAIELNIRRDPTIYDGQFSNNGWLQELPKPMNKLTWDNAIQIGPAMAKRLNIATEDVVELELNGKKVSRPRLDSSRTSRQLRHHHPRLRTQARRTCWNCARFRRLRAAHHRRSVDRVRGQDQKDRRHLQTRLHPGHAEHGHARRRPSPASPRNHARGIQERAQLRAGRRAAERPHALPAVSATTKKITRGACRSISTPALAATTACSPASRRTTSPSSAKSRSSSAATCTGFASTPTTRATATIPKHSSSPSRACSARTRPAKSSAPSAPPTTRREGLNDMVYNRCVGTRYCSNNCPYKVRRFNFLLFQDWETPQYKMMRNPDVSVRSRGVMEKCTYCVQRINEHRIDAEREDRKINDAELQTACQQSCPAGAIVFGNINDPNSKVSKLKAQIQKLQPARRTQHASKNHVPGRNKKPEPGVEKLSTVEERRFSAA